MSGLTYGIHAANRVAVTVVRMFPYHDERVAAAVGPDGTDTGSG
ncbi:hypothetical protein ACQP1W_28070 [Spirillospora sp. CA-255316]